MLTVNFLEPSGSRWEPKRGSAKMIQNVLTILAASTPALRARYLDRVRTVRDPEAREIERRLQDLVEQDRRRRVA